MEPSVRPCLEVTGLHIEGLKALRRVNWPADGMGWNGKVPSLVMVGGINGSGKTTLLELIGYAALVLVGADATSWDSSGNAWIDLRITSNLTGSEPYRLVLGDDAFVQSHAPAACATFTRTPVGWLASYIGRQYAPLVMALDARAFSSSDFPRLIYFATDRRLEIPDESFKAAGDIEDKEGFFYRFQTAKEWKDSLGALLYGARWADLNAKEEGHPEKAIHFASYAQAFQTFFGDSKSLTWEGGKLYVKIAASGDLHPLMELSSGEKQALIFAAELYRRWRPGSLVLIDEPELHFHSAWQTALWLMLERLQQERGGQVIVTTQSTHLFGIAKQGTTVLLGKGLEG